MNRNFATFCLVAWIIAYVLSGWGANNVGPNIADLASKFFWVFLSIWIPLFVIIVLQALDKFSKEENARKSFDWSSLK